MFPKVNIEVASHWEFCFTFQLKNKLAWLDTYMLYGDYARSMSGKSKPVLPKPYSTFFFFAANYNKDNTKVAFIGFFLHVCLTQ